MDEETKKYIDFLSKRISKIESVLAKLNFVPYFPDVSLIAHGERDDLYEDVVRIIVDNKSVSVSFLQSRFDLGFIWATRILAQLERDGAIGPHRGSLDRELLISDAEDFLKKIKEFGKKSQG